MQMLLPCVCVCVCVCETLDIHVRMKEITVSAVVWLYQTNNNKVVQGYCSWLVHDPQLGSVELGLTHSELISSNRNSPNLDSPSSNLHNLVCQILSHRINSGPNSRFIPFPDVCLKSEASHWVSFESFAFYNFNLVIKKDNLPVNEPTECFLKETDYF